MILHENLIYFIKIDGLGVNHYVAMANCYIYVIVLQGKVKCAFHGKDFFMERITRESHVS